MTADKELERQCFEWWKSGLPLAEIQRRAHVPAVFIRQWVVNWERGAQGMWEVGL